MLVSPLHAAHRLRAVHPFRFWAAVALYSASIAGSAYGDDKKETPGAKAASKVDIEATTASSPKDVGTKIREALGVNILPNKKLIVSINAGKGEPTAIATSEPTGPTAPAVAPANRRYLQARAAATKPVAGEAPDLHWAYDGETGPQAWGRLKPEFSLCRTGRRQSPISIDESSTLQGPAEPIQFNYTPSNGTVVNTGRTIQVAVQGENSITLRGSSYQLLEFHFHTPSEEIIDSKRAAMVVHLVHRNAEGQLAVVAVLLDVGADSPLVDKVWTYMPLDVGDRVRLPNGLLNLSELLPTDQRYYQYMGSLTEPPCTEGVLWVVLKAAMTVSKAQLRLFTQLYPNNARPIQPTNARPVRDAR